MKKPAPKKRRTRDPGFGDDDAPGLAVGARVEVTVTIQDPRAGAVTRPAFGRIVALDQVAVLVEGECDARAFEPGKVKPL